jgi:hypothetical protein
MDYVPALTSFSFRVADENWRTLVSYRVAIQKDGQDLQTLYWGGSLEETRRIARRIACMRAADCLRIFELGGAVVCFEQPPFGGASEDL